MLIILNRVAIPRLAPSVRVFLFTLLILFVTLVASITAPYGQQQPQTPRESGSVAQRSSAPATEQLKAEGQQLTNEKLRIEIEKLQLETTNSIRNPFTFRGLINLLYENGAIIGAIFIGAWGFYKYLGERQKERLRREEERFEQIVKSLGSEHAQERVGAAVSLPTFLHPEYERFYIQVFNLAAGNLRIPTKESSQRAVAQALVTVLRDSYPRARNLLARRKGGESVDTERSLNAAGVHMEHAYLASADLVSAWLRQASLVGAALNGVNLRSANLEGVNLSDADLGEADLRNTNMKKAQFVGANLEHADLSGSRVDDATFEGAKLVDAVLDGITAGGVNFSNADLTGARLKGVEFLSADAGGRRANPESAAKLQNAKFVDVQGLSTQQIEQCRIKGAIFEGKEVKNIENPPKPVDSPPAGTALPS